jgi:ABC-2 type transport system permease protein
VIIGRRFIVERRRSLLWWAAGVVGLVVFTAAFFPSVRGQVSFEEVYEDLPASLRAMLGTTAELGITSAPGYLQGRLFGSLLPVVLLVLAIGQAVRATAGAEEDGTLEQLVILPVRRRDVLLQRAASCGIVVVAITALALVATLVVSPAVGLTDGVALADLVAAFANVAALAIFHGALALCIGAVTGRRALASGVASAVAVGGFLLQGLLAASDPPGWTKWLTPWHWYLGRPALVEGWTGPALAIPLAAAAVLVVAATLSFERRDLR